MDISSVSAYSSAFKGLFHILRRYWTEISLQWRLLRRNIISKRSITFALKRLPAKLLLQAKFRPIS